MANFIIFNVRIFDGTDFTGPKNITIKGANIQLIADASPISTGHDSSRMINGAGKFLAPGFIDCHVHVREKPQLLAHARHGVTTVLDMGCWPAELTESLRNQAGHADFLSAGYQAFADDSPHAKNPHFADLKPVVTEDDAVNFVNEGVQDGSDFVKIVLEGTFEKAVLETLVQEANKAGKLSIAHVTNVEAFERAYEAGVNILTHAPLDAPLSEEVARRIRDAGQICVPTLVMMNAVMSKMAPGRDINAITSTKNMHRAGVPILVGTDANESGGGGPAEVLHGDSFRTELTLLSISGMSLLEILRATSMEAAKHFGLSDRGLIEPGKRADLVLLGSNPLRDLAAYRRVEKVFCRGELID